MSPMMCSWLTATRWIMTHSAAMKGRATSDAATRPMILSLSAARNRWLRSVNSSSRRMEAYAGGIFSSMVLRRYYDEMWLHTSTRRVRESRNQAASPRPSVRTRSRTRSGS